MARRLAVTLAAFCLPAGMALPGAARAGGPVVVELFTSQGCSSCPPADALLRELARRPDLLALDMHVTYWDRLGWRDPYSLPAVTERQQRYAALLGVDGVYTPQLVAGGRHQAVGSDRAGVAAAIAAAQAETASDPVALTLRRGGAGLLVAVRPGASGSGARRAVLLVIGFDPDRVTPVGRGENAGRMLAEANVVREIVPASAWAGQEMSLVVPRPAGERAAALLQAEDGRILAAAVLPPEE